jgi:hypothetical protein
MFAPLTYFRALSGLGVSDLSWIRGQRAMAGVSPGHDDVFDKTFYHKAPGRRSKSSDLTLSLKRSKS